MSDFETIIGFVAVAFAMHGWASWYLAVIRVESFGMAKLHRVTVALILPLCLAASPAPDALRGSQLALSEATEQSTAVIDLRPILDALAAVTSLLPTDQPADGKFPVFMLDSNRLQSTPTDAKDFDNRWMVFPQDFPSGTFLRSHGVLRVLLIQDAQRDPSDDLAHVLRRWQDEGIEIRSRTTRADDRSQRINVHTPSQYKALWYRALAIMGLRRNAAGGFGDYIPDSTSAG